MKSCRIRGKNYNNTTQGKQSLALHHVKLHHFTMYTATILLVYLFCTDSRHSRHFKFLVLTQKAKWRRINLIRAQQSRDTCKNQHKRNETCNGTTRPQEMCDARGWQASSALSLPVDDADNREASRRGQVQTRDRDSLSLSAARPIEGSPARHIFHARGYCVNPVFAILGENRQSVYATLTKKNCCLNYWLNYRLNYWLNYCWTTCHQ